MIARARDGFEGQWVFGFVYVAHYQDGASTVRPLPARRGLPQGLHDRVTGDRISATSRVNACPFGQETTALMTANVVYMLITNAQQSGPGRRSCTCTSPGGIRSRSVG